MNETEQAAAVRVYTGDCAQHVRNIILAAMSAAGAAHLKNQLEESLAALAAYERMSTDINTLQQQRLSYVYGTQVYPNANHSLGAYIFRLCAALIRLANTLLITIGSTLILCGGCMHLQTYFQMASDNAAHGGKCRIVPSNHSIPVCKQVII
eukprot:5123475-Pleurochrysis_carterae.AAC.1